MIELRHYAECVACEWSFRGDGADREAARHTKKTGHGTVTRSAPHAPQPSKD